MIAMPAFYPTMFAWTAVVLSTLLFLAVLLRWKLRADDVSFLFLVLCNLAWDIGFIFSWPFRDPAEWPYRSMYVAACLLPGAFVDFLVRSTESRRRWAVRALYGVGLMFILTSSFTGITYGWKVGLMIFVAAATLLALFEISRAWNNSNPVIRFRARYMFVAILAASIGGLSDMIQGMSGRLPVTGALGSAIALAMLAVATARLEVVAVHPMALDLVVFGMLGTVYAGAGVLFHRLINPPWWIFATAILVISTLRPLAEAFRLFLKRVLLGLKIQEDDLIRKARDLMLSSRAESELTAKFRQFMIESFQLAESRFWIVPASVSAEEMETFREGPVTVSDATRLPPENLRHRFETGEVGAAFGFFRDTQFAGLLLLSPKLNGRRFFPDEFKLIETIGQEMIFAHENLRLSRRERLAELGEAIAQVSHEIKNPLTTIIASAEILKSKNLDPHLKDVSELVVSELRRLKALVNQYLEFARPYEPGNQSFDLSALAREIVRAMEGVQVESNGAVPVVADESGLRQVFLNLIQNARDAGGSSPVEVGVKLIGGAAVVQVRDKGRGIDSKIRDRLFEPFVTGKSGGTGLGLAICKRIIDAHGGEISVTSGSQGTVFEFRLRPNP